MKNTIFALTAGFVGTLFAIAVATAAPTEVKTTLQCGNNAALEAPCEQTAEINPTF